MERWNPRRLRRRPRARAIPGHGRSAGAGRRAAVALLLAAGWAASLFGAPPWSATQVLDPRIPLEIARLDLDPPGDTIHVPVLFDLATNALELVRVDISQQPFVADTVPVATGSIFALGTASQAGSTILFSFVDQAFDLRAGLCTLPCNTVANLAINTASVWLDSSSAASGDDLFVAGLDNATQAATIFYSSNGGAGWNILRTLSPAGGILPNFEGGERIGLVVDSTATNPATTRNCLFFEVEDGPSATQKRLSCADGSAPAFDIFLANDVPNPLGQFDNRIENSSRLVVDGLGGSDVVTVFDRRANDAVQALRVNELGQVTAGPEQVGTAPPGSNFYGLDLETLSGSDAIRILFPAGSGVPANDVQWEPPVGHFVPVESGPTTDEGPLSFMAWSRTGNEGDAFLYAFFTAFNAPSSPVGAGGFGVASFRLPLFFDGFETGSTARWDATAN